MKRFIPRPREGWRVFAGEVGVIVLGVLLALGAQEAATAWQWRNDVARTRVDLNAQLSAALVNIAERAAFEKCGTQRLKELAGKLATSRGQWTADPLVYPGNAIASKMNANLATPYVYGMPARPFLDDVWQQAKASGMLAHMEPKEIADYAGAFSDIDRLAASSRREIAALDELAPLAFDGPLTPSDRHRALIAVAQLQAGSRDPGIVLPWYVAKLERLGVKLDAKNEKELPEFLRGDREANGPCVDVAAGMKVVAPFRMERAR